ncbi:hypothetical protein FO488_17755 [Geobacter sp. FeAm09]|uniref:hypothetical protein n=1 Tax=Geobacter sp. FeAm09 TaxID=2597769 RepID=UPI0011EE6E21|nr:hypothetical protein [Geobacter sp. FeAm09]QEM69818.1 hypothetical protein FO488_17755 [Geobacter sp. FeAm09]
MSWFSKPSWPDYPFDEIKKRAKILVVDDNDFPYDKLFSRDGYTFEKWNDIENLPKLESGYYDIILLDINGVGLNESEEQGLGILKHLRKTSPSQIIIAYSNADWPLKYQDFFDMADSKLDKRKDYIEFKQVVDKLLKDRFSLGFYVDRIIKAAGNSIPDTDKLKKVAIDSILGKNTKKLSKYIESNTEKKDIVQIILGIAQVAIGLAAL